MSNMLIGCMFPCVLSISGCSLVVMGGRGNDIGRLSDVQMLDGKTWHFGSPLPEGCWDMSAVVHGGLAFAMGGRNMERAVWSTNITDLVSH